MSCFPDPPPEEEQAEIITQLLGDADVSLCPTEMRFSIEGGITNAEFDTLTLTPLFSGQGWTGAIAKGEMIAAPS